MRYIIAVLRWYNYNIVFNIHVYVIILYLQNQCATEVDDEGEFVPPKRGTCGPGCPTEDDDVWVTDDTLTVTRNFDTDTDSFKWYQWSNIETIK